MRELSSYDEVKAALRDPQLWPVAPLKTKNVRIPDAGAQQALRAQVTESFSPARLSEWQAQFGGIAVAAAVSDLVADFIQPWCLAAAGIVTGTPPADWDLLLAQSRIVSRAAAEPMDEDLRQQATKADAVLAHYFRESALAMPGPTFVALSRTVACILANGWLALAQNPAELALIRGNPDLLPKAAEEILRYAAIPRIVFRHEEATGERIALHIAAANRDPLVFSDPDRFDINRRGPAHLSLGFGEHPCAGSALIRVVVTSATSAFVRHFGDVRIAEPIEWEGGRGFRSPVRLAVVPRG